MKVFAKKKSYYIICLKILGNISQTPSSGTIYTYCIYNINIRSQTPHVEAHSIHIAYIILILDGRCKKFSIENDAFDLDSAEDNDNDF